MRSMLARTLSLVAVVTATACSKEVGVTDPEVWSAPAYRNVAATVVNVDGSNWIASASVLDGWPEDSVTTDNGDGSFSTTTLDVRGPWRMSIRNGETGEEVASSRAEGDWSLRVHALGVGSAAFWFDDSDAAPEVWTWSRGASEIIASRFPADAIEGAAWELVILPGTNEVALCTLRDSEFRLQTVDGGGPPPIDLPSFDGHVNKWGLNVDVVSTARADGDTWRIRVKQYVNRSRIAAMLTVSRDGSGWRAIDLAGEHDDGDWADEDAQYAELSADLTEPISAVHRKIELRHGRDDSDDAFRTSGPITDWPVLGGLGVPVYRRSKEVFRREFLDDRVTHVAGTIGVVDLATRNLHLESRIVVEYPDMSVAQIGLVGEDERGLLYWLCVDGELTVHRRANDAVPR